MARRGDSTQASLLAEEPHALFCDVALPVPLDVTFTYAVGDDRPVVGGRVVVAFGKGAKRLSGIVTRIHRTSPPQRTKRLLQVLDTAPVLDTALLALGRWIARYYLAPIGEVYRAMLPLQAEFRHVAAYRLTALGALAQTQHPTSTLETTKPTADEAQPANGRANSLCGEAAEKAVLDALAASEQMREERLRAVTKVARETLRALLQKKWIERLDLSAVRDARRVVRFATLCAIDENTASLDEAAGTPSFIKLNASQQHIVDLLATAENRRLPLAELREAGGSPSSLKTLIKHGRVAIVEEPAELAEPRMKPHTTQESAFTDEQQAALRQIRQFVDSHQFHAALLHGVTGSGKTAVYLAAMQAVLQDGRGAILLVPEIGLTPSVVADLHGTFGDRIAILHSSLTDDERAEQWHRIRRGEVRIAVGTRSAIFAPVQELALIIVDEEHDHSYKQEETPRYHARDVAVVRAKELGATVVLGSATPSLESFHNASRQRYTRIAMPNRVQARPLPEVELIDMREEFRQTGKESVLSRRLIEETTAALERGEQAMILLNRRGYSSWVMCRACGDTIECPNCAVAMTYHKREHRLLCHYCGAQQAVPKLCPKCGSEYVQFLGTGSEKLEDLLHATFPQARIGRMDRDTVRGHDDFERMLCQFQAGELDLLVGTQMIAKGHDVHGVTLVGVVGADTALGLPDFRAAERTFQLLTQVAGRAGRGERTGKVVLQTLFPDHYAVQFATQHDYQGFAEKELQFRGWMHYPPFAALANLVVRSEKAEEALRYAGQLGRWFEQQRHPGVRVMGPAPAPLTRLKRDYRYHFVLKSESREQLNALLRAMLGAAPAMKIPITNLVIDVDAMSLS